MVKDTRSIRSLIAPQSFLPSPPRRYRLSILLLTLAAYFTCVTSQASKITITVPDEVYECVPTNITWYGGTPPYTLGVHVGSTDEQPDEVYTNISTTFFLWSTDVVSDNFVVFAVGDNLTIANSDLVEVQAGLTQECVPNNIVPFTSTVGGGSAGPTTTKTQGAPASQSGPLAGQPPPTSESVTSTTVTVSVTDSVGGTNAGTPTTTNTSSASDSRSHSSLSPDVIGIIVAVAVVLLIVVIWVVYKYFTRNKLALSSTSTSTVSTPLAPAAAAAGAVSPYVGPPTSPTVRATNILSASPNYSPVGSPSSMSALQFAPYGYSPPAPPPPALASTHPTWQGAAVHTTQTQTYFVGNPATLASGAPSVLSKQHEPSMAGWNTNMQETYAGQTQWQQETAPTFTEQGRFLAIRDAGQEPGVASTEGGSDSWRAMLSPPQARRP